MYIVGAIFYCFLCAVSRALYTLYSTAVSLSGALLRLRVWHKMHLQIVTCRDCSVAERYAASYPASLPLFRLPHCNV